MSFLRKIRDRRVFLAAFFLIAVCLRVGYLLRESSLKFDEVWYLIVSHHYGTGQGYADWRGPETHVHPLHPVLTSLFPSGLSLQTRGRVVTLIASLIALLPLVVLARRLFGEKSAILAMILLSLNLWLTRASVKVEPESLYILMTACALLLLIPARAGPEGSWRWAASGALFGLAYLARPEGVVVGVFAGVIASLPSLPQRRTLFRMGLFLVGLLLVSSPFLIHLRSATGAWTLTGKLTDLFQAGQAVQGHGPEGSAFSQLAIRSRWSGFLSFIAERPVQVAWGAARNGITIICWILPRALGPVGLVGVLACGAMIFRSPKNRMKILLVGTPVVVLFLMFLTYPNERIVASIVPFLLILASGGLLWMRDRLRVLRVTTVAGVTLIVILSLSNWCLAMGRALTRPPTLEEGSFNEVIVQARRLAGPGSEVLSNSPVIAFAVGDPVLFGPPGRYRPLQQEMSCEEVEGRMQEAGDRVAVISHKGIPRVLTTSGGDCSLVVKTQLSDPTRDDWLVLLSSRESPP